MYNSKSESTVAGILLALAGGAGGEETAATVTAEDAVATVATTSTNATDEVDAACRKPPRGESVTSLLISKLEMDDDAAPTLENLKTQVTCRARDNGHDQRLHPLPNQPAGFRATE